MTGSDVKSLPMGDRYHLDCFSGLAGDMFLGACLDLGMPLAVVEEAVAALGLEGVSVEARSAHRAGLAGTRFRVLLDGEPVEGPDPEEEGGEGQGPDHDHRHHQEHHHGHSHEHGHEHEPDRDSAPDAGSSPVVGAVAGHHHHHHDHDHGETRNLPEIRAMIEGSSLEPAVRDTAVRLFSRLGEAEARAHGVPVEKVHFHEVGALDSIVDLVGAAAAYHHLAPERLTSSRVNAGGGTVGTAHGRLPVPAPATAWLMRGLPMYGQSFGGRAGELLTPTGAVILAELVDGFGDLPALALDEVGYGLGKKEIPGQPNAVRLIRGRSLDGESDAGGAGRVVVIEAEVDDLPGEGFGFLMERLLEEGALDVYFTPVQMKKNRPGTLVTVLGRPGQREELAGVLLVESGSLGCRYVEMERMEAERTVEEVETEFGTVRVKVARFGGRGLGAAPEYDDCRRLAREHGVAWREVYRAALKAG